MNNPLDDALMSKEAILGGFFTGAQLAFKGMNGPALGAEVAQEAFRGLVGAASVGAVVGVAAGAKKLLEASRSKRDFKDMLTLNPDLAVHREDNPTFFNAAYTSLRNMNPTFAKDPVVAGGMMRRMMESPESAGGILAASLKAPDSPRFGGFGVQHKVGPLTYTQQF